MYSIYSLIESREYYLAIKGKSSTYNKMNKSEDYAKEIYPDIRKQLIDVVVYDLIINGIQRNQMHRNGEKWIVYLGAWEVEGMWRG